MKQKRSKLSRGKWILLIGAGSVLLVSIIGLSIFHAPYKGAVAQAATQEHHGDHPLLQMTFENLLVKEPPEDLSAMRLFEAATEAFSRDSQLPFRSASNQEPSLAEVRTALSNPNLHEGIETLMQITPEHVLWYPISPGSSPFVIETGPEASYMIAARFIEHVTRPLSWYVQANLRIGDYAEAKKGLEAFSKWMRMEPVDPSVVGLLAQHSSLSIFQSEANHYFRTVPFTEDSLLLLHGWLLEPDLRARFLRSVAAEYHIEIRILEMMRGALYIEQLIANEIDRETLPIPFIRRELIQEAFRVRATEFFIQYYDAVKAWHDEEDNWPDLFTDLRTEVDRITSSSDRSYELIAISSGYVNGFLDVIERETDRQCIARQGREFLNHIFSGEPPREPDSYFLTCDRPGMTEPLVMKVDDGVLAVFRPRSESQMQNTTRDAPGLIAFSVRLDNSPDPHVQAYWAWFQPQTR